MKFRLIAASVLALLLVAAIGIVALAEQAVPAPYAGAENPFPWDDTTAQQAGKKVYQQSCLGCHGAKGDNLPGSNFSASSYGDSLQAQPDLYFWITAEGSLSHGMPPFKSALSDEQRWQALTYIRSLSKQAAQPPASTPPPSNTVDQKAVLQVTAPREAQAGQHIYLTAYLQDDRGKPISNVPVKFSAGVSFFAQGQMELGEVVTDDHGAAVLETVLRESGDVQVIARSGSTEAATILTLTDPDKQFYRTIVGIRMPSLGSELLVGPVVSEGLAEMGQAPTSVLRIPGGTLSWLLLLVLGVLTIWTTYLFVVYQVVHISSSGQAGAHSKLFPRTLLVAVALMGLFLALKILTGPYSQLHLFS